MIFVSEKFLLTGLIESHHEHAHEADDCNGDHAAAPHQTCDTHLTAAFDRYLSYLESARCLCRVVLARHGLTCCDSQSAPRNGSSTVKTYSSASGCSPGARDYSRHGLKNRTKCGQQRYKDTGDDLGIHLGSKAAHIAASKCFDRCSSLDDDGHPVRDNELVVSILPEAGQVDLEKAAVILTTTRRSISITWLLIREDSAGL